MKIILYKNKRILSIYLITSRKLWMSIFIHRNQIFYINTRRTKDRIISPNFDYINKYILFNKK